MTALSKGDVVGGDFEIEEPLSSGGMGAVYIATQRSTGVRRALKVMRDELLKDEKLKARFLKEAKVAAQLKSAHVAHVLTAGVDEGKKVPYLVMELLEGRNLADVIKRHGPISPGLADVVLEQVAHALGEAAKLGIVHRDLKPENIFVCPPSAVGMPFLVKVLDFGIAKVLSEGSSTQSMGTPFWFAPEQMDTKPTVSTATDVWPFGLLAFYLLTGKIFWESARSEDAQIGAVLRELVIDPIPTGSERAASLGWALPSWFDAWFAKCLVRDRMERFPDASRAYAEWCAARGAANDDGGASKGDTQRLVATLTQTDDEIPSNAPTPEPIAKTADMTAPGTAAPVVRTVAQAPLHVSADVSTPPPISPYVHHAQPPAQTPPSWGAPNVPLPPPRPMARKSPIAAYVVMGMLCLIGGWGALTGAGSSCRGSTEPTTADTTSTPTATEEPTPTRTFEAPTVKNGDPLDGKFTLSDALKGVPGTGDPVARIKTSKGTLSCKLYSDKAPNTVANFIGLATGKRTWKDPSGSWVNKPAYDNTTFHRVIKGFMIQGGDARGNGTGEPGYTIKDEIWSGAKHDRRGLLCMANRGPNTNGAQFFIMDAAAAHLDGGYTIFGECSPGSVVEAIANVPTGSGDRPTSPVNIESVTISRGP